MANQAIALQARAPQTDILGGAIRNNAQMINMMAQQQAAQRQNAIAEQTMQIQRAEEGRKAALAAPQLAEAQSRAGSARQDFVVKAVGHALHTSVNNPTDETLDQAARMLAGIGLDPAEIEREITPIKQLPLDQRKGALMQSILSDPNSKAAFEATLPKPAQMRLGDKVVTVDQNPLSPTFNQPIRTDMVGMTPKEAYDVSHPTLQHIQGADNGIYSFNTKTGGAAPVMVGGGIPGQRGGGVGIQPGQYGTVIESAAMQLAPGTTVSGRGRTPERNAQVGGVANSYHLSDNARDLQPAKGQSLDQLAAALAPLKQQGFDVVIERARNHVHVEPGPGMARAGAAPAAGGGQLQGPVKGAKAAATANAKTTQQEQTASYNINRVLQAAAEIQRVTKNNPSANAPSALEATVSSLPLISQGVNFTRSSDRQIVAAAQRDLLDGLLYLATGAAYNKEQLEGQIESYIPAYSDAPATVASKRARLAALVASAKTRAGQAWTPQMDAALNALINSGKAPARSAPSAKSGLPDDVRKKYGL